MKAYIHKDDLGKDIEELEIPDDMKDLAKDTIDKMVESSSRSR